MPDTGYRMPLRTKLAIALEVLLIVAFVLAVVLLTD